MKSQENNNDYYIVLEQNYDGTPFVENKLFKNYEDAENSIKLEKSRSQNPEPDPFGIYKLVKVLPKYTENEYYTKEELVNMVKSGLNKIEDEFIRESALSNLDMEFTFDEIAYREKTKIDNDIKIYGEIKFALIYAFHWEKSKEGALFWTIQSNKYKK